MLLAPMTPPNSRKSSFDLPTIVAIGMVVYLIKNLAHEGLGHGGVCLAVGGDAVGISSAWWDCGYGNVSDAGRRWVAAAGTLANLGAAGLAFIFWVRRPSSAQLRLFLWFMVVINLFSGAGYMMADAIGAFGDWAVVYAGQGALVRGAIGAAGLVVSVGTLVFALRTMEAFLGRGEDRLRRARWLCFGPYVVGD